MHLILFDSPRRTDLLPLTYTRPVGDLRVGILTIKEKWELWLDAPASFLTADYLAKKFEVTYGSSNLYLYGGLLPSKDLLEELDDNPDKAILNETGEVLAFKSKKQFTSYEELKKEVKNSTIGKYDAIYYPYDIFLKNGQEINSDFELLTKDRKSEELSETNTLIGNNLFIEEGAQVEASILNTSTGPIYIGKNATIMEGSVVRGPLALSDNSELKMGAKIYGPTTLGPFCKVGGEVSNVVFQAYSNKGHDGFLGNSVIGEWCNLGADTNSSNLKNNYAPVRLWNYGNQRFINTGLQFCGLIMGDHSKCGINTMFNTGTVVGVSSNIFGAGFPRNFIPSFTWGGSGGYSTYMKTKAFNTAEKVMERRNKELNELDKEILTHIFELSSEHRLWENKPINT